MYQKQQSPTNTLIAEGRYSYYQTDLIGTGATGNVYKGHDHAQNRHVAIKVIRTITMNQTEKNLIQNQKKALRLIKHQNIMKLLHIEDSSNQTYIVSELYQGGTLKDYLSNQSNHFFSYFPIDNLSTQDEIMQFFHKIVNAYCSIVEANIIHRDLKPANILLSKEKKEPYIIDFGYSQIILANRNMTVFNVGSPSYMAPEAYLKTIYSQKSDLWSLGIIFYEILTRKTLDDGIGSIKIFFNSLQGMEYPSISFQNFQPVVQEILKGCLAIKPQNRITPHKLKYLLDKEVIGKKLCKKVLINTEQNQVHSMTHSNTVSSIQFSNSNNSTNKSTKNLNSLLKDVDYIKLRQQQQQLQQSTAYNSVKTGKKKAMTMNMLGNNNSQNINELLQSGVINFNRHNKQPSYTYTQVKTLRVFQSNPYYQKGSTTNQELKSISLKATPSISQIQYNGNNGNNLASKAQQQQPSRNHTSSIKVIQTSNNSNNGYGNPHRNNSTKNVASTLVYGFRESYVNCNGNGNAKKNYMEAQQDFQGQMQNTYNLSTVNKEYFNQSTVKDCKNLTHSDKFYNGKNKNSEKIPLNYLASNYGNTREDRNSAQELFENIITKQPLRGPSKTYQKLGYHQPQKQFNNMMLTNQRKSHTNNNQTEAFMPTNPMNSTLNDFRNNDDYYGSFGNNRNLQSQICFRNSTPSYIQSNRVSYNSSNGTFSETGINNNVHSSMEYSPQNNMRGFNNDCIIVNREVEGSQMLKSHQTNLKYKHQPMGYNSANSQGYQHNNRVSQMNSCSQQPITSFNNISNIPSISSMMQKKLVSLRKLI